MAETTFAALPLRAISDLHLSAAHFRVLAAVAMHDRMSRRRRQGQGCLVDHAKLAKECGLNRATVSVAIGELMAWGYVSQEPSGDDKRRRVLRVIYDDGAGENLLPVDNRSAPEILLPTDDRSAGDVLPKSEGVLPVANRVCCLENRQPADLAGVPVPNRDFKKKEERESAEAHQSGHSKSSEKRAQNATTKPTPLPGNFPDGGAREEAFAYWRKHGRPDLVQRAEIEIEKFRLHFTGELCADWARRWRTWFTNAIDYTRPAAEAASSVVVFEQTDLAGWVKRLEMFYGLVDGCPARTWSPKWGAEPGADACRAPADAITAVNSRRSKSTSVGPSAPT